MEQDKKNLRHPAFFRPVYVDQIPHKSLGSQVNVFLNKYYVA